MDDRPESLVVIGSPCPSGNALSLELAARWAYPVGMVAIALTRGTALKSLRAGPACAWSA
ncbi:MAG TPA: hypothetical protein VGK78_14075 [Nocardioides sp.]|uniref:hypothetical protein n=1 Tax=Nocardioides sp. TaxID=35761 RepID=UPI002F3F9735